MTKAELLAELVARDDELARLKREAANRDAKIADLYQQLADTINANNDSDNDARRDREDTADTRQTARSSTDKRSAKIPDPPIFYNEEDRDTEDFEQWYRDVENKLEVNDDHFRNDRAVQAYIESRLGGKAKRELAPYLRSTHPAPVNTSAKLLAHLWRQYYDPTMEQKAFDDYDNLKLEPGDDFLAFKNDFVRLAGETGRPRSTWKHEFNRKLYSSFQRSMVPSFANPAVTFDQFVIEAQQIAVINKRESERQAANRRNQNNATRGKRAGTRVTGTPTRKQGVATTKPLSADDVRQLYEEGRCFTCRDKGHLANDCPRKERSDKPREFDRDRNARIAYLQKRWATKPSKQSHKEDNTSDKIDDSTTLADDSASEQEN
jgi:hypothetical protein